MWNSINYYHKGKSINALNYKMAVAKIEEGGKKIEKVSVEPRTFVNSRIGKQRRGKLEINSNANVNTSEIDNDYGREVSRSHLVGPLGSKYLNMHMECDTEHNNINDSDKRGGI